MAQMAEAGEVVSLAELFPDGVKGKRIRRLASNMDTGVGMAHQIVSA